ncbi:MAG: cysteine desulfurase family protein [Planctomycetaceae bacterium]
MAASSPGGPIYLDHAATTPLRTAVDEAMREAAAMAFANASSPHEFGRRARRTLEEARERILSALGARTSGLGRDRLVFTSGATESNRLALLGRGGPAGLVAWSPRDHASVAASATDLVRRGWQGVVLTLDEKGSTAAATAALVTTLPPLGPTVVRCLTTACGQTGTLDLPDECIGTDARISLHVDHTQAVAWIDPPIRDLHAATLTLAPHKFGGPRGIGGLVIRGDVPLEPLHPGPQELGLRGGTEAVPLAVGFAVALESAVAERRAVIDRVAALRRRFEDGVAAAAAAGGRQVVIIAAAAPRAPHVSTIAVAGIDRQSLVMAADLAGVCLATGTACASGSSEPSAAIEALHLPAWVAPSAFRASIGITTSADEVDEAVRRLARVFQGVTVHGLQSPDRSG